MDFYQREKKKLKAVFTSDIKNSNAVARRHWDDVSTACGEGWNCNLLHHCSPSFTSSLNEFKTKKKIFGGKTLKGTRSF